MRIFDALTRMQLLPLAVRDADEGSPRAAQVPDVEHALRRRDVCHVRDLIEKEKGKNGGGTRKTRYYKTPTKMA